MKNLKNYFNSNIIAYSYLFFAQTSVVAIKIYNSFGLTHHLSFVSPQLWIRLSLTNYLIPLLFIMAGFATLDYSTIKDKEYKKFIPWWNFFMIAVIISSAVIS